MTRSVVLFAPGLSPDLSTEKWRGQHDGSWSCCLSWGGFFKGAASWMFVVGHSVNCFTCISSLLTTLLSFLLLHSFSTQQPGTPSWNIIRWCCFPLLPLVTLSPGPRLTFPLPLPPCSPWLTELQPHPSPKHQACSYFRMFAFGGSFPGTLFSQIFAGFIPSLLSCLDSNVTASKKPSLATLSHSTPYHSWSSNLLCFIFLFHVYRSLTFCDIHIHLCVYYLSIRM